MGTVYVLINPSFPDLVKIGYTLRSVEKRREELSNTSVPNEFILVYQVQTNSPREVEAAIHQKLDSLGFRINSQREFFNAPIPLVIDSLLEICASEKVSVNESPLEQKSNLELAFDYLWGKNDVFKDEDKAKQLFAIEYQKKNYGAYYPYLNKLTKSEDKKLRKKILIEGASNGCLSCSIDLISHFEWREYSMESMMMALSLAFKNFGEKTFLKEPFLLMHDSYEQDEGTLTQNLFESYFMSGRRYFDFFEEDFNRTIVYQKFLDFGRIFEDKFEIIFNEENEEIGYDLDESEPSGLSVSRLAREVFFRLVTGSELNYSEYDSFVEDFTRREYGRYIH